MPCQPYEVFLEHCRLHQKAKEMNKMHVKRGATGCFCPIIYVQLKTQRRSLEKQWMLGHRVARPSLRMRLWVRTMYSEQGILFSIDSIEDVEDSDHLVSYSCQMNMWWVSSFVRPTSKMKWVTSRRGKCCIGISKSSAEVQARQHMTTNEAEQHCIKCNMNGIASMKTLTRTLICMWTHSTKHSVLINKCCYHFEVPKRLLTPSFASAACPTQCMPVGPLVGNRHTNSQYHPPRQIPTISYNILQNTLSYNINQYQSMSININQYQTISNNINQYQSISTNINQYQSISININQYQPISNNINQYQTISTNINQYQSISININQYQSISNNIKQYQTISTNINQYQSISTNINQYQSISININQYQSISYNLPMTIFGFVLIATLGGWLWRPQLLRFLLRLLRLSLDLARVLHWCGSVPIDHLPGVSFADFGFSMCFWVQKPDGWYDHNGWQVLTGPFGYQNCSSVVFHR